MNSPRPPWLTLATLSLVCAVWSSAPAHAEAPDDATPLSGILRGVADVAHISADDSDATWSALKGQANPRGQLKTIARRGLAHTVCTGLADLREIAVAGAAGFTFRDDVRGRSFARASLAWVMTRAIQRFQAEQPDKTLSLGDIAQPGCGPLNHGVLVKHWRGEAATALADRARVVLSTPTVVEVKRGGDFGGEADRFEDPTQRVRVEHRILGKEVDASGAPTLRVATVRHRELAAPDDDKRQELEDLLRKIASRRNKLSAERRMTASADGQVAPRWVTTWLDRRTKRQLVAVTRHEVRRRVELDDAVELRFGRWHPKKPGSVRGEIRWIRGEGDTWTRWQQLYEAGHISHHSGRDADISWVTKDNRGHFTVDLDAMDVAATWRWLEILVQTGHDLGAPIDKILIDRKIRRHFKAHLPRRVQKTVLWRNILAHSGGHDAHHHVRILPANRRVERRAARALTKLMADAQSALSTTPR